MNLYKPEPVHNHSLVLLVLKTVQKEVTRCFQTILYLQFVIQFVCTVYALLEGCQSVNPQ